ncbi:MAG TPA: DUF6691 family protein [Rhodocyclaceae bacterium]|jgi:hypothetical protein
MRYAIQLLSGLIFGLGLALAGMTSPQKVLAFLDIAGDWNPALLFVLGGAVITAAIAFRWILKRDHPLLDTRFHLSKVTEPDVGLVLGSVIFGIGWGISGYCPGPGIALLAVPKNPEALLFLTGLLVGFAADYLCLSDPA